ncbi:MAG TPA: DNA methyltransferase [Bryocella sp.]|nr:DNA methyltransferase [Bryocella sp.]
MPEPSLSFIERWQHSAAAERANYALFLSELCDFLEVPRPDPTRAEEHLNTYVFEKSVTLHNLDGTTSTNFIDLYRRNHFVLEAKQGSNAPQLQTNPETGELILTPPAPQAARRRRGTAVRGTHGWDEAMLLAYNQAERYAKALPTLEGWPPFLVTVDVGHSIELFADFSLTGKAYLPFPDARSYRISLNDLTNPAIRERLRLLWTDPHELNPARHAAKVTREVAAKLAILARTLEQKYSAKQVAEFLTRCIFTSFAEDVKLLPEKSWLNLLCDLRDKDNVAVFPEMAKSLWETMNAGGFSPILKAHVLKFNGGLFESTEALPLKPEELGLLIDAADSDWKEVEPAIFGTLLERALDPDERHQLGAHYTPRAYVERLVIPTIVEPLRADWSDVIAAVSELVDTGHIPDAIDLLHDFHRRLCNTRVLDPACGSGNFLYVALEHLKRLEGEIIETLATLGETQQALEHMGRTVDPHQLLGIDINPRATAVADLVLWIGYLQWHFRTRGDTTPRIPVIDSFHNIDCRDALMEWQQKVPAVDADGNEITEWDGVTLKENLLTGRQVPDETARRTIHHFLGARQATWPDADFIIGNPPFIGGKDIRSEQEGGYVDALRKTYPDVPDSADFVMYWWQRAAELTRSAKCRRFGFITTNSLPQVFNRRVVAQNLSAPKNPLSLLFAIPDHPWLKSAPQLDVQFPNQPIAKPAAVRIAMTVAARGDHEGHLYRVIREGDTQTEGTEVELSDQVGKIFADLRIGADVTGAAPLRANEDLSCPGVKLHGSGFIVTPQHAKELGLGRIPSLEQHIRPYLNGRDLTGSSRNVMVIDLFGLTEVEVRTNFPEVYQLLRDHVKAEREAKINQTSDSQQYAEKWWLFGKVRAELRLALRGLPRYISTVETAKHRVFVFLEATTLPDNMLVNIASADAFHFGVLSSKIHVTWALAAGGTLEDRPRYNKTRCFDPFPFPACTEVQQQTIRDIAERLDAHRKRQQQLHPSLTLTEMYNVLEKLRALEASAPKPVILSEGVKLSRHSERSANGVPGQLAGGGRKRAVEEPRGSSAATTAGTFSTPEPESLTPQDRAIYDAGLIGILREIHAELDRAVSAAYGWPSELDGQALTTDEILARIVALNAARRAEEASGLIRWLRPEFQAPTAVPVARTLEGFAEEAPITTTRKKQPWPGTLPEQVRAIKEVLRNAPAQTPQQIAAAFRPASRTRVAEILSTLVALGQARALGDRFSL